MQYQTYCRRMTLWGSLFAICLAGNGQSFAQAKNEFGSNFRNRRTVSPYLSTLDNGSGYGALNYYNIVKPQQRAQQAARKFDRELHDVESNLAKTQRQNQNAAPANTIAITTGRMEPTGHSASFGNTGSYFGGSGGQNNGRGGGTRSANQFGRNGKN